MNLLGRMIPSAVQSDEDGVVEGAERFDNALVAQGLINMVIKSKERFGRNRIEGLADVVIAGDVLDLKKALHIALPFSLLQGPLKGQEGRRLGKENREGAGGNVLHAIASVIAGAAVGQSAEDPAQVTDEAVPRFGTHEASLRRKSATSGLR